MFTNDEKITTIHEGVYVYKNFIPKDLLTKITNLLPEYSEPKVTYEKSNVSWYKDKLTDIIPEMYEVWELISKFLLPTHVIHPALALTAIRPGDGGMFVHEDSPGKHNHDSLTQQDKWSTCCLLDYGVLVYFGDWEGGEIFYPNLGIEISPKAGDLVIHGAHSTHKHGVKEVTSGIRFAFSNFALKAEDNPGTFPNYGTPENEKRIAEGIGTWINPYFENIREYASLEDNKN
jgi:hypothetical protein